jgi:hypothetical protein
MRFTSLLLVVASFASLADARTFQSESSAPKAPAARAPRPDPREGDTNIAVETDTRLVTVAAALVVAGYASPGDGPGAAALRRRTLEALAGTPADLRERLQTFYRQHRRPDVDEALDASRYRALALMLNPPPSLSLGIGEGRIPPDVRPLAGFASLAGQLNRTSQFRALLPELIAAYNATNRVVSAQLQPLVAGLVDYMHALPVEEIVVPARTDEEGRVIRPGTVRVRMLRVYVDPLLGGHAAAVRGDLVDATDKAERQVRGDRYAVFAGETLAAEAGLRLALVRYYLDPLVERYTDLVEDRQLMLNEIINAHPAAKLRYEDARVSLVADSLTTAAEARLRVKSEPLRQGENRQQAEARAEVQALAAVAEAHEKGQVLAFHFWERLKRFEEVGVDLGVVFRDFVESIDPKKEQARAQQVAAARAALAALPKAGPTAEEAAAEKMLAADQLITAKRFAEARPILEDVLRVAPTNARALFGLAQAVENTPEPAEVDAATPEDDRAAAQEERLERAINLYRQAALNSGGRELWIASWSHVYAARILDFLEYRAEAIAEYDAAKKIGDVPGGAYAEAAKVLSAPRTQ